MSAQPTGGVSCGNIKRTPTGPAWPDHLPLHGEEKAAPLSEEMADELVPASFEGNLPERIAYLHIDLNQAPAEVAALDSLFDRMVPGGILVLDDYEWSMNYRSQKLAEDEWFDRRGYRVMPLPTGQGLVFKR